MGPMEIIDEQTQLDRELAEHPAVLLYFSGEHCGVCQSLRPRLEAMLAEEFPRLRRLEVKSEKSPALAAAHSVFSLPVAVLFFDGREGQRFARSFGLGELRAAIERPYAMIFEA